MTWVKLDDSMPEHPKIAELSNAAFRLHIEGLCYSARTLSDGAIPAAIARRLAPGRYAAELVDAGVWDEQENGSYLIHDYLEYQPSRAQVEDRAQKRSEAGRSGAAARWGDGKPHGKRHSKSHGKRDGKTMPRPDPIEEPTANAVASEVRTDVRTVEQARPGSLVDEVWEAYRYRHPKAVFTPARRDLIRRRLQHYDPDRLVAAIQGNHLDPHCNGENDRGREYHDIELILRDAAHIERYEQIAHQANGHAARDDMAAIAAKAAERGFV